MIKEAKNKAVGVENPSKKIEFSTYKCAVCGREVKANYNIRISCINCNQPLTEVK